MKTTSIRTIVGDWSLAAILCLIMIAVGCTSKDTDSAQADQYTCPMHPTVLSPTQGACPVCGMDLVRKARSGEELKITEDIARLVQSPDEAVVAGVPTTKGVFRKMNFGLKAQGIVTYDSRHTRTIPARVGGRLEQVYLRYALQPVRVGQKVAEIYSPEMLTAQKELLYVSTTDPANETLLNAARQKLLLLGATAGQMDEWLRTGKTDPHIEVYSQFDGYVLASDQEMSLPAVQPARRDEMGVPAMSPSSQPGTEATPEGWIRKGDYVTRGQALFTVVSKDAVRVEVNLQARNVDHITTGSLAKLDIGSGRIVDAQVDFVQPFYDQGESFVKVRIYARDLNLKIGHLVIAAFDVESPEAMWLKREAVYELGGTSVVFVKDRGLFRPRRVSIAMRQDGWVEVRTGLTSTDEVAAQAAFLVDSESFIQSRVSPREASQAVSKDGVSSPDALMLNDSQVRLANISTRTARMEKIGRNLVLNGSLVPDETRTEVVSSRVDGRVERLFVKETGRSLRAGEPFLELYSETLLAMQREYLLALEQSREQGDDRFVRSAEQKLLRYGLLKVQVDALAKSGQVQDRVQFLAPLSGIVTTISVKEGQWVEEGAPLFRTEDTRRLWVEAELYPGETANVKIGSVVTVTIAGFESQAQETTVVFIAPEYRENSQITMIRAILENRERLYQPGMQAEVLVRHSVRSALAVPTDAVIRTRDVAYLFVMTGPNTFEQRQVTTGLEDEDKIEIVAGLKEGETVVVSGAYLLYSELILKRGTDPMAGHDH